MGLISLKKQNATKTRKTQPLVARTVVVLNLRVSRFMSCSQGWLRSLSLEMGFDCEQAYLDARQLPASNSGFWRQVGTQSSHIHPALQHLWGFSFLKSGQPLRLLLLEQQGTCDSTEGGESFYSGTLEEKRWGTSHPSRRKTGWSPLSHSWGTFSGNTP